MYTYMDLYTYIQEYTKHVHRYVCICIYVCMIFTWMQCNPIQFNATMWKPMQCNAMQCKAMQR